MNDKTDNFDDFTDFNNFDFNGWEGSDSSVHIVNIKGAYFLEALPGGDTKVRKSFVGLPEGKAYQVTFTYETPHTGYVRLQYDTGRFEQAITATQGILKEHHIFLNSGALQKTLELYVYTNSIVGISNVKLGEIRVRQVTQKYIDSLEG
ncbi:hypothetical protein [Pseudomonas fluorescens]|uniref:hypothetical protein n=1 Tax=Pseudomonas fluorescens TaxID=294 RepID=UPI000642840C|nr:hypothetical protein [Pseudomonas fluorescens]